MEPTRVVIHNNNNNNNNANNNANNEHEIDFWEHEPTKDEIWEMKRTNKPLSEWLKILCKDWVADTNIELINNIDTNFESYKPYLKGKLSSQLLCRLCIPSEQNTGTGGNNKGKHQSQ